jgi:trimeric autotransporter adhesin
MRKILSLVVSSIIVLSSTGGGAFATPQAASLDWATTFSPRGLSFDVNAVAVSGNSVYVGGGFIVAGNVEAHYIARYDLNTQTWSPLGSGAPDAVTAMLVDGNDIYVGGEGFLSRWNTISNKWTSLSYVNGFVNALAKSGSDLYVGGVIDWIAGQTMTNTARLNLTTGVWSTLGSGVNGAVHALTISGNVLYAGGGFTQAGGNAASSVAQWNIGTNTWSALSTGPYTGTTYALAMHGAELIAGGSYANGDGTSVYRWDGSWHAMGTGTYSTVDALNVNSHGIYAGATSYAILRWDGSSWVQVGADLTGSQYPKVFALAYANDHLYAGGAFTAAGSTTAMRAADLNLADDSWSALFGGSGGNGLDGAVNTIVISGTDMYVGGEFTRAGPTAANYIAKWNGSSWSALGVGVDFHVLALALQGNTLYVGGRFTSAGGNPAHYIAQWNTGSQTWSTLSSNGREGVIDWVAALAITGTKVYVGGYFTRVGWPDGPATDYFGVWNTNTITWTTVNPGLKNYVDAVAVHGTDVYVGGGFYPNGGSNFDGLARWNTVGAGNQWSGISGVGANVYALAASGNDLFVGGTFSPRIKRLNMTDNTWRPMSGGVYGGVYGGIVYAIAAHADGDVYVGGDFTGAGGRTAYNLARWNPACDFWLPVGTQGMNDRVLALATTTDQALAGGRFSLASQAGGNVSSARLATLPHQSITCQRVYLPSILK